MIDYIGENLLAGKLGTLLIQLSFLSGIIATVFYWKSAKNKAEDSWRKIARSAFQLQSIFVFSFIGILFYLIYTHAFEYYYVWRHSSSALPTRFILSCFWEGQEGSTMLWAFWNLVIGNILIFRSKEWESTVMTVFASVQLFLVAMLLGIFPFDIQIGSNPFLLLREHPDMFNLPFTQNPEYLSFVEGNGLNPLLQNYWMTIHPPTVFLGFALTLIPFAYAVAGLWKEKYTEWIKPALSWTYVGIGILGLGILMGGAWAYEALSFGGFWAWDPVENSSLVPWIILVAAGHLMLINQHKARSLFAAFALTLFSFLTVVYSTYLTKSGILGETSVHSFADGLPGQLIIFLLFYLFLALYLIFKKAWKFLKTAEEEALWSREFWIFLASLVLIISAFQITLSTSIPVINELFGTSLAPSADPIKHYNSWQIPLAIAICLLLGLTQFLKYQKNKVGDLAKNLIPSVLGGLALTVFFTIHLSIELFFLRLLLFASSFSLIANLDYFIRLMKGKLKNGGSSIAHVGFSLVILGSLLSAGNKKIISKNRTQVNIQFDGNKNANNENVMLLRGDTVLMEPFYLSLIQRRVEDKFVYYDMDYLKIDENGQYQKQFRLSPYIQLNQSMGNVPEPSTKHYWDKDIFTHITYADLNNLDEESLESYGEPDTLQVRIGDSLFASNSLVKMVDFDRTIDKEALGLLVDDIAIGLKIEAKTLEGEVYTANPVMVIRGNQLFSVESSIEELGIKFNFNGINPENEKLKVLIAEKNKNKGDFVIMQAIIFPYINILWIGSIIMVLGSLIAVFNRIKLNRS